MMVKRIGTSTFHKIIRIAVVCLFGGISLLGLHVNIAEGAASPANHLVLDSQIDDGSSFSQLAVEGYLPNLLQANGSFTGFVYEGAVGDQNRPLQGVEVTVYGRPDPNSPPESWLNSTLSIGNGAYALSFDDFTYYSIILTPPDGFRVAGASSVSGIVVSADRIDLTVEGFDLDVPGNNFWLEREGEPGPPNEGGPDLFFEAADSWYFEDENRLLVIETFVVNGGTGDSGGTEIRVYEPESGWDGWAEVPFLGAGDGVNVEVWLEISPEFQGRRVNLLAFVDPEDWVQEVDEDNNLWQIPPIDLPAWEEPQAGGADLAVFSSDYWDFDEDQDLILGFSIENLGTEMSGETSGIVESRAGGLSEVFDIPEIDPGSSEWIEVMLFVPEELRSRPHIFLINVDPEDRVPEVNERNNRAEMPEIFIPGYGEPPPDFPPRDTTGPSFDFDPLPIIVGGLGILLIGILGIVLIVVVLRRLFRRPPGRPPEDPSRPPPLVPGIPPIRLMRIWVSEGGTGKGQALSDRQPLRSGTAYTVHLDIQPRAEEPAAQDIDRELDIVFYADGAEIRMPVRTGRLALPGSGPSGQLRREFTPLGEGQRRIRACVYYRNTLLQSAILEAAVGETSAQGPDPQSVIARAVDYVASPTLRALNRFSSPRLSIFTNEGPGSSHWIGVFSRDATAGPELQGGSLHTYSEARLSALAESTRAILRKIQGERRYRFVIPLDAEQLVRRERLLVELAINGYDMYDALFASHQGDLDDDLLRELHAALQDPGTVSVARCRGDSTSIPWAALYSLPLDTGKAKAVHLCPVFKTQLLEEVDLLDEPKRCRSLPNCPLRGPEAKATVCPFGFWGLLHQVEQPLQQVNPTHVDRVPEELKAPHFEGSAYIQHARGEKIRLGLGVNLSIPDAGKHLDEISGMSTAEPFDLDVETNRDRVLSMLEAGGRHIFYLYCHGKMVDNTFNLQLGSRGEPGYIRASNLDSYTIQWPAHPQPLVILNGCETMALIPERIHGFLGKLRRLGGAGLVGSEVEVHSELAREFGVMVLEALLSGNSIGEAFLAARRSLQRQANPLGLVYTSFSYANLHLHDPSGCPWCER
jgi:hypothetical protein